MTESTLFTIIISIISSVIGGLILFHYLNYRSNNIRKKIEDVKAEEEFLEKLNKGNIKLLRSTFLVILFSMFFAFFAAAIVLTGFVFQFSGVVMEIIYWLSIWLLLTASALCFMQFRAIASLNDIKKAKTLLNEKKKKLESKL